MDKSIKRTLNYMDEISYDDIVVRYNGVIKSKSDTLPNSQIVWFLEDVEKLIDSHILCKNKLTIEQFNNIKNMLLHLVEDRDFSHENKQKLKVVKCKLQEEICKIDPSLKLNKGIVKKVVSKLNIVLPFVGITK